jgi:hypothetical protein
LALAASVLGAPYLSNLIAGSTGLTGSALAGATGATIAGGSTALTGGSTEDTLKAALLGGGGGFLGSEVNNLLYDSTAAADLAAGLDPRFGGSNPLYGTKYDAAMSDLLSSPESQKALADYINGTTTTATTGTPVAVSTPVTDGGAVNITGAAAPVLNAGGLLSSVVDPRLTVTAPKTPQQVDQATMALLDSQLAANKGTAPPNLANVEVTAKNLSTTPTDAASILAATLPALPNIPAVATPAPALPTQTITAPKTPSVGDTLALLPATMLPPSITNAPPTTPAKKTNELGLTDEQMLKLLQVGLGLFGTVGATSALGGTNTPVTGIPTQTPPMYTDDYFTRVQQNYNSLLPAVPRDVASPLRDWYTSQYGA